LPLSVFLVCRLILTAHPYKKLQVPWLAPVKPDAGQSRPGVLDIIVISQYLRQRAAIAGGAVTKALQNCDVRGVRAV
jgi:hypothetical protein